jgi:predicted phosphodiesterase
MRIAICSDVHLEFGQLDMENTENAEVLILSGDICTATGLQPNGIVDSGMHDRYMDFFTTCSGIFPHVLYVMGNHEHYNGDYATSVGIIKNALKHLTNVHVLDKEVFDIGDYRFIGGTLWTDMNGEDENTIGYVASRMNDFRICQNSAEMVNYRAFGDDESVKFKTRPATLSPRHVVEDHKAMLKLIEDTYAVTPPWMTTVVCSHHAPSKGSEHPRYSHDKLMNGAYNSVLDEFILDRPGIKLWTHGHTHEDFDYMVGSTRVVCNPRGYIHYEERADNFKLKVVEL